MLPLETFHVADEGGDNVLCRGTDAAFLEETSASNVASTPVHLSWEEAAVIRQGC
jgi:hypothetical protein